jgi:hypothetical protein
MTNIRNLFSQLNKVSPLLAETQKNTWRKNRGLDEQTQLERLLNMLSILN